MINVLIASNNIYYSKAIMDVLDNKNIKVTNMAIDGIEALGLIKTKNNIDIVILELELASYNGIKIINTLIRPDTVLFIKPDYEIKDPREVLNKYMEERGYEEIKEDEIAGNKIYTNGQSRILVEISSNKYVYCCIINM